MIIDSGSNKSLYTLIAVVVFGIFLSLSYFLFQDQIQGILASVVTGVSEMLDKDKQVTDSGVPSNAPYEDPDTVPSPDGDFVFDKTTGTITGYVGLPKTIVIPFEIDGVKVTAVGNNAFQSKLLTSVIIPNTVKSIGNYAFASNRMIILKIPNSVETIGDSSFSGITTLTSITLGDNVKSIGNNAFQSGNLTSLETPDSLESLGNYSFRTNKLTTVKLNEGLTTIGGYVFDTNSLTSIIIPKSVTSIGSYFVDDNPNLQSILFPISLKPKITASTYAPHSSYKVHYYDEKPSYENGFYIDSTGKILSYVGTATNLNIPSEIAGITVREIDQGVFADRYTLTNVTLPNTLKVIGSSAFNGTRLTSLTIPNSVETIGDYAFRNMYVLSNLTLGTGLKTIGYYAFQNNSLTNLTIPSNVETLYSYAFADNKLTNVALNEGLLTIQGRAFDTNSLTSIIVPKSVTTIGSDFINNNPNMQAILFPSSLKPKITASTYAPHSSYKVHYYDEKPSYENGFYIDSTGKILSYVGNSTNLNIPSEIAGITVTSIDQGVFADRYTLTNVNLPNTLNSIGPSAFNGTRLTSLTIPNSVETIGDYAFRNMYVLSNLTLGTGLKTIGYYAFQNNSLTNLTIPSNVETLYSYAFADNKLTNVALNEGLLTIQGRAFDTNSLTSIVVPKSVTTIGSDFINNNPNMQAILFPSSLKPKILAGTYAPHSSYKVHYYDESLGYENGFYINSNGNLLGYVGSATDLTIPSVVAGKTVISIDQGVFADRYTLTNVNLPNTLKVIGSSAFNGTRLTSLTIPNSVETIGDYAFRNMYVLSNLTLGTGLKTIGYYAFQNNSLTNLTIPSNVETLYSYAFAANKLTNLELNEGLLSIQGRAFDTNSLTSVNIPNSLITLGSYSFEDNKITIASIPTFLKTQVTSGYVFNGQAPIITYR